ncbi:MAG: 4Fe-4S dicluster domain-containing protein [Solirubrobacteraceae bacterium MAG38_C4-C5]|nr:4Fe-4S dicluster domain-containing protein [Candidatus Siliceabacter maunaloa]
MRTDALFIGIEVADDHAADPDLAARLEEVCPVDIYAAAEDGGGVRIVEDNVDECVLCRLCLDASPPGAVRVLKLYEDGAEL